MSNLFQIPPQLPPEEFFEILTQTPTLRIERIISTGQTTPPGEWYDQPTAEWVVLLQGNAILTYEDQSQITLSPGDYLWIPAHCKHRVDYTSSNPPCLWLAIHALE